MEHQLVRNCEHLILNQTDLSDFFQVTLAAQITRRMLELHPDLFDERFVMPAAQCEFPSGFRVMASRKRYGAQYGVSYFGLGCFDEFLDPLVNELAEEIVRDLNVSNGGWSSTTYVFCPFILAIPYYVVDPSSMVPCARFQYSGSFVGKENL